MTQHEAIIEFIKEFGSILPAKQHGFEYKGTFLGSELSKRCRELRAKGVLVGKKEGRFERFYLVGQAPVNERVAAFLKEFPSKPKGVVLDYVTGQAQALF